MVHVKVAQENCFSDAVSIDRKQWEKQCCNVFAIERKPESRYGIKRKQAFMIVGFKDIIIFDSADDSISYMPNDNVGQRWIESEFDIIKNLTRGELTVMFWRN